MYGLTALALLATLTSFISGFIWLGGWGWMLFLWFDFIGLLSVSLIQEIDRAKSLPDVASDSGITAIIALLLTFAFVGGVLFGLSDLLQRISVFYMLFGGLFVILLFGLFGCKRKRLVKN
jgi:hypothetical protein